MITATGEKLVASGLCLSRTDEGEILFVEGLIPGEKAEIKITEKKRKTLFGEVLSVEKVSQKRVDPPCKYVEQGCGGCDWQHIDVKEQPIFKKGIVVDALNRIGKITETDRIVEDCLVLSNERYRTSARVLVNENSWGFRSRNTNSMVEVDDCLVLHHECVMQAQDVMTMVDDLSEAQLRRLPDPLFDHPLAVSEKSFYQSHIDAPKTLVNMAREEVNELGDDLLCVDLYSGVGIFSLGMAIDGHRVVAVESNRSAVKDAEKNLKDFNAKVICADVNKFVFSHTENADAVIADPAREGLGKEGLNAVLSCAAKKVILISCDPASGARDIRNLIDAGYELKAVTPIDMFAHTHHVEMFSVLFRRGSQSSLKLDE